MASANDNPSVVALLLNHGADPNIKNVSSHLCSIFFINWSMFSREKGSRHWLILFKTSLFCVQVFFFSVEQTLMPCWKYVVWHKSSVFCIQLISLTMNFQGWQNYIDVCVRITIAGFSKIASWSWCWLQGKSFWLLFHWQTMLNQRGMKNHLFIFLSGNILKVSWFLVWYWTGTPGRGFIWGQAKCMAQKECCLVEGSVGEGREVLGTCSILDWYKSIW